MDLNKLKTPAAGVIGTCLGILLTLVYQIPVEDLDKNWTGLVAVIVVAVVGLIAYRVTGKPS